MENLSRRSFLALGTLGAASAAAAGLAGCAPQTKGSASTDRRSPSTARASR